MSFSITRTPLLALALFTTASIVACGDDSGGTAGGGGEAATTSATTSATTATTGAAGTTTSSTTGSTTSTTTGGEGGQGTGGDGTGGDGTGGAGTGGTGSGGGQPAECTVADLVDDDFSYETQLVVDGGHYECSVEGVDQSTPTIETTLFCIQGDVAFEVTLSYTPQPALTGEFPLTPGQEVTFDDLSADPDDPPVSEGYVVRSTSSGKLLFSWVYGSDLAPPLADADWADPLAITDVEDLCTPDEDAYEHRALDVVLGDDAPVRIFSDHIAVLEQAPETFEIRVSNATYNAEISGGFNRLFRYAILAPELIGPE